MGEPISDLGLQDTGEDCCAGTVLAVFLYQQERLLEQPSPTIVAEQPIKGGSDQTVKSPPQAPGQQAAPSLEQQCGTGQAASSAARGFGSTGAPMLKAANIRAPAEKCLSTTDRKCAYKRRDVSR